MNDMRRVAFVTEHFLELQGLVPAAFGGALLFALLVYQTAGIPGRPGAAGEAAVLAMILGNQAAMYLQASYRRTFGDVRATRQQKMLAAAPAVMLWAFVTVDMLRTFEGRSGPSFAAIALASSAFW